MAFTHIATLVGSSSYTASIPINVSGTDIQIGDVMVGEVLALDPTPRMHPPQYAPNAWWQTSDNIRTTYDGAAAGYRIANQADVDATTMSWTKSSDQAGYAVMSIFRPSPGHHAKIVQGGGVGRSGSGGSGTISLTNTTAGNLLWGVIIGWSNDSIALNGVDAVNWTETHASSGSVARLAAYKTAVGAVSPEYETMSTGGWYCEAGECYNYKTMFEIEEVADFPVVQARNADTGGAEGTSHTIDLPAGVAAGDMLLVKAHAGDASGSGRIEPITSWGVGWNEIGHDFAWKKATGAETTFTFSTASNAYGSGFSWIIDPETTTDWTVERPPEATSSSWDGTNRSPNPSPHVASWGTANILWVTSGSIGDTFTNPTYPPGWGETQTLGDSSYPSHSVAENEFKGTAANPGPFGWAGFANEGNESTVAISPLEVIGGGSVLPAGNLMAHDGTSWVDVKGVSVNTGSWVRAKKIWVHDGGDWVAAWQNEVTETFPYLESQSYYGTGTDAAGFRATTPMYADEGLYYLALGTNSPEAFYQRALWVPGKGSYSAIPIADTLLDRTILDFRISIGVTVTADAGTYGDNYPCNIPFWGSSYSTPPATMNPSELVYLGVISLYPNAYSYEQGWATLTAAQLGTNPPIYGDRHGGRSTPPYQLAYQNVSIFSQLDSNAKTKLTNGFIKSIVIQPYYYDNVGALISALSNPDFEMMALAPGQRWNYAWTQWEHITHPLYTNYAAIYSDPNAFTIKVTHKG